MAIIHAHKLIKIGILTASISRQSGGLMWSIRSLAQSISGMCCSVKIFSGRDSHTETDLQHWQTLDVMILARHKPLAFGYMPMLNRVLLNEKLDLLHAHGLWMYPSVAALRWRRRLKRPVIISPHGMLDSWALHNSVWKKQLAGWLYEKAHLRGAACLHALCVSEYESIRAYGLKNPVAVIPNGVDLPEILESVTLPDWFINLPKDSKVLLFLGRIHPKKGLVNLLHAWAQVCALKLTSAESWQLVIAGWGQSEHLAELRHLTEELGIGNTVFFVGPQFDEQKIASLACANAFVLPSFSEGLPIAVLEAWSYRLPALITPQCNLPEGLIAEAAIEIEAETNSIIEGLIALLNLSDTDRYAMGQRGRKLVEECFTWPVVAAQMYGVYAWMLGQQSQPPCVIMD